MHGSSAVAAMTAPVPYSTHRLPASPPCALQSTKYPCSCSCYQWHLICITSYDKQEYQCTMLPKGLEAIYSSIYNYDHDIRSTSNDFH
ncbi:hypothetical protein GUJ93_ZPchr0006g44615 [Zizania palustris]|uniref:Uncharacterized protein n=1 Tax=Zizania palustris TaxID=103762 RepID=A0A8J5S7P1_ZIZPA|nr:hypothetical protein GUJ93_ZPchr0006g44615 [Zizania palustris]